MKNHFIKLFKYDYFANNTMLEVILNANQPEKTIQLMAHLLAAQKRWLNRVLGLPDFDIELWSSSHEKQNNLDKIISENHDAWINYLNTLAETDFEKTIEYKNSGGESFSNQLSDIIVQVINHGTHHRAQIGQLLKSGGYDLPGTDYIFHVRKINS